MWHVSYNITRGKCGIMEKHKARRISCLCSVLICSVIFSVHLTSLDNNTCSSYLEDKKELIAIKLLWNSSKCYCYKRTGHLSKKKRTQLNPAATSLIFCHALGNYSIKCWTIHFRILQALKWSILYLPLFLFVSCSFDMCTRLREKNQSLDVFSTWW